MFRQKTPTCARFSSPSDDEISAEIAQDQHHNIGINFVKRLLSLHALKTQSTRSCVAAEERTLNPKDWTA